MPMAAEYESVVAASTRGGNLFVSEQTDASTPVLFAIARRPWRS
jgi:hypothetical protein